MLLKPRRFALTGRTVMNMTECLHISPHAIWRTPRCSWCWRTLAVIDFHQFVLAVILSIFMYGQIIYTLTARSNSFQSGQGPQKQTTAMMFRSRNQISSDSDLEWYHFLLMSLAFTFLRLVGRLQIYWRGRDEIHSVVRARYNAVDFSN